MGQGIVVRFPVVTDKKYTNLCIHTSFAPLNKSYLQYQRRPDSSGLEQDDDNPDLANLEETMLSRVEGPDGSTHINGELIRTRICEYLNASPNKILLTDDIMDAVVRAANQ